MFTDMVGYSDLTQRDEAGALKLLNEHRQIVRPLLSRHGGREVKTIGDAFMVEFSDGLSAVRCALDIQERHAERNRDLGVVPITIRIGLHAGEVIHQEGDLYGDAVNVASRIEPLAPPGGICLSESVYEVARTGMDVQATPIGPATLKNIHIPIPVYRIDLRPERYVPTREGPWVDREVELARVAEIVDTAISGAGSVLFLSGEAGVGKTRLAEQGIRFVARHGILLVRTRGSEDGTDAPYSVWAEALQGILGGLPPEALRAAVVEYADEIRSLWPELPLPPLGGTGGVATDPDRARDRIFAGVAHALRVRSRETPIVLLLDDLQWMDTGSLRLLEALAKDLAGTRILVLGCYRPDPDPSRAAWKEIVRSLVDASLATALEVRRLDLVAVRQLVLALVKTKAIPDAFVRRVFQKTRGNPFFVEEVVRSLREQGVLPGDADRPFTEIPESLPLPDTVRRLVRQRIERLDPAMVDFCRTVAVLGAEFPLAPLPKLVGLAEGPLLERLGEALALGLLEENPDERGGVHYAFVGLEVWETVYADTPVSLRTRCHLRAGEALESLALAGTPIPSAELAHHFQQGREPGRALRYALSAAEEAERLAAREEAVRHYRTSLEILESRPDERLRLKVMEALADHLYRLGQLEAAQAMRREATDRYERLGELRPAGNLHRKIAQGTREDPETARHHWEEARRLLEEGPETPELARLYNTIAGFRYEAGEARASVELYARAVEIARRVTDPYTQVASQMVLAGLLPVASGSRVFEELDEALRVAREQELNDLVPNLCMVLALARLHVRGDGSGAERALADGIAYARKVRDVYSERAIEGNLVTYVAWRLGQYERALREVEAHATYAAGDPRKLLPVAFLVGGDIELTRGNAERAGYLLEEAGGLLQSGGDWSERVQLKNLRGRSDVLRRRYPRARVALKEAHELAIGMGVPAIMAVLHAETLHLEVETELATGQGEAARRFLAQLEALDDAAGQAPLHGFARRARGLVHESAGDLPASEAAYADSANAWEGIGWSYELARTRLLLGGVCRREGATERADTLETAARSYLERLGGTSPGVPADPGH